MTAITADTEDFIVPGDTVRPGRISQLFRSAARAAGSALGTAGSLAFEFVKANPVVSAIALDLAFTGGFYTQTMLVAATKTVAGALGTLTIDAGAGLWGLMFG